MVQWLKKSIGNTANKPIIFGKWSILSVLNIWVYPSVSDCCPVEVDFRVFSCSVSLDDPGRDGRKTVGENSRHREIFQKSKELNQLLVSSIRFASKEEIQVGIFWIFGKKIEQEVVKVFGDLFFISDVIFSVVAPREPSSNRIVDVKKIRKGIPTVRVSRKSGSIGVDSKWPVFKEKSKLGRASRTSSQP